MRIRNLLEWSDVDRCRLLILVTVPFVAAYTLRTAYVLSDPTVEPYYDRHVLVWMRNGLGVTCLLWMLFLAWGSLEQRRPEPHTVYLVVGTVSWWLGICGVAYVLGPITSPAWIAVVIGGVANLLLFPRRVALLGIGLGMTVIVASLVGAIAGLIPYAPVFADSPIVASQVALPYTIGNTIASVVATLIIFGIMGYTATQWRTALTHLQRVNVDLQGIIAERTRELVLRKRAEEALRANEERYRMLAENAGDLVAELNAEGLYEYASPSYQTVLGYAPDELLGTDPFDRVHPDDCKKIRASTKRVITSGIPETKIYRTRRRDGEWRWVEAYGRAFETPSGSTHLLVVIRDITERQRAEEEQRKLETQMQQTQKLESLGVLAGGIAHDFNNLLLPILGNARLAEAELEPDSSARRFIERVETAGLRASELTNELLAYAGRGKLTTQRLNVGQLLRETAELLRTAISRKVELRYELPDFLPPIEGDPAQLRQVILNLITNASEAIGDEPGVVTLTAGTINADRAYLGTTHLGLELPQGSYVYVEVRDTGCGMDEETKAKIFDPFFTTKFAGRGLGLAALLGIVRAHWGTLKVESQPGQGTAFRLLFPRAAGSQEAVAEEVARPLEWHGSGTVLVVDDEEVVRELLEEVIRRCGMSVVTAKDGREAVERFREHEPEIDVVVLDVTMPEIGGVDAFLEIRKIRPDARVDTEKGTLRIGSQERKSTASSTSPINPRNSSRSYARCWKTDPAAAAEKPARHRSCRRSSVSITARGRPASPWEAESASRATRGPRRSASASHPCPQGSVPGR
jgi:PAS domain S-box-containing protein